MSAKLLAHADEMQANDPAIANVLRQVVAHRGGDSAETYDVIEAMSDLPEITGVEWADRWRIERYVRYMILAGHALI